MKKQLTLLALMVSCFSFALSAQDLVEFNIPYYHSKRNYAMVHASLGGGDYPFGGAGITLSRQLWQHTTMLGLSVSYIAQAYDNGWTLDDQVQIFPIMADIRYRFTQTPDNRFATYIMLDAGYVASITGGDEDEFGKFEYGNGWAISPGVSFRFNILKDMGLMLDINWLYHTSSKVWDNPMVPKTERAWNVGIIRGHIFF